MKESEKDKKGRTPSKVLRNRHETQKLSNEIKEVRLFATEPFERVWSPQ